MLQSFKKTHYSIITKSLLINSLCFFFGLIFIISNPIYSRSLRVEEALAKSYKLDDISAIKLLARTRKSYQKDSRLTYRIGWLYHKMNRRKQALVYYQKTHTLNPCHAGAWNNRGNLALDSGKSIIAEKSYRKAIKCNKKLASGWYNLANMLRRNGMRKQAIQAYNKTLKLKPGHSRAHHNIALIYINDVEALPFNQRLRSKSFLFAKKHLDRSIKFKSKDAYSWYNKGRLYSLLGDKKQAIHDYKRARSFLRSGSTFRGRIEKLIQSLQS